MEGARRRRGIVALLVLLLLLLLLLLRCPRKQEPEPERTTAPAAPAAVDPTRSASTPAAPEAAEVLTAATLEAPAQVTAGAALHVAWTGPDNRGDYVILARADAPPGASAPHRPTSDGPTLELTAPDEPGAYELRYETGRSHTVLGRVPLTVVPAGATLDAPSEVVLGAPVAVAWTGPDNEGDFITIVAKDAADGTHGNYTPTARGSPLSVTAPATAGECELRYVTGQESRVLARRPLRIVAAAVALSAPAEAVAGATIQVTWSGPDNAGDFLTVVPAGTRDGEYGNYAETSGGSPLALLLPILSGDAELRYMTGQGYKVLARRALRLVAAEVSLSAPDEAAAGTAVGITWKGPDHGGDYVTIVAASAPDGQYGGYTYTSAGSPLTVAAPASPGPAEIRYMAGQGDKVLARRPIRITQ